MLLSCATVGCERLPTELSCERVRRLKFDMTEAEVRTILGEPALVWEAPVVLGGGRQISAVAWEYGNPHPSLYLESDGFSVYFDRQRLRGLLASRSRALRLSHRSTPAALWAFRGEGGQADHWWEGHDFAKVFGCQS